MSRGFWIWTVWVAYFLIAEGIGIWRNAHGIRGETLSEYVWGFRNMTGGTGAFTLFIFILLWAIWHFWLEGEKVGVLPGGGRAANI